MVAGHGGNWSQEWALAYDSILGAGLLWLICFVLVKIAGHKPAETPALAFFRDFHAWKGVAALCLWPAADFYWRLAVNYHEALTFNHFFNSILRVHFGFLIFSITIIPMAIVWRRKHKDEKPISVQDVIGNLVWGKFFFDKMNADQAGRWLAKFVGVAYFIFLYMAIIGCVVPAGWAATTSGYVVDAQDQTLFIAQKYGSRTLHYCVLTVEANNKNLSFAFHKCPDCTRKPGVKVTVTHNPIDYYNRRLNSAACTGS